MTRAVSDRILKDANGDISDHLRNHIHLTNCIHLKNHMHKHSPNLRDRPLVKELIALQRSRSLRDPSASPSSKHSPSVIDFLSKRVHNNTMVREGRRSVGDHRRDSRRLSVGSPVTATRASSKVSHGEESRGLNRVDPIIGHSSKSGVRENRVGKKEESTDKSNKVVVLQDQGNHDAKSKRTKHKVKRGEDVPIKTLSEQLNEGTIFSDGVACSHFIFRETCGKPDKTHAEPEKRIRGSNSNRVKRNKFRTARRNRAVAASNDIGGQNELSVASNSLASGMRHPEFFLETGYEEYDDQNFTKDPRNGCGIPWNWSRIHHRGKSFLDMAGRSLSCGLTDPRLKKEGLFNQPREAPDRPVASDNSSPPTKSDAEVLPLLVEAYGSQESTENAAWEHDYSGELGIFADNLLKRGIDTDLASEARSDDQCKPRGHNRHGRHQNLTQKYTPRTFRDLVGQNLVVQALSNAVVRRKVGLLYVFYGPHGTGKTSCARIFARALNCQSSEQPKPCGLCNSCIAHDMGKSRNIREIGPVSHIDFESIMDLLENMSVPELKTHCKVFIIDDCDTLSSDCWSAVSKIIDRAPRRVVFVLVCSSLDVLPHIIISRCQKFFFPKLKDADIIHTLQWVAAKEKLEIDKDALRLIASRSDGSLRDAEMTLDQLSLLGQRISVPLVQELVGLISDEKLVYLLDLALSADTVNTVKNLRVIMETGVEPLALMSQLATVITDILAGSYDFTKENLRRKFFQRQPLSKEDMEKLRQALKTLSEAEKQLRMSNDKLTWLTAALLQLAPDHQYLLPNSCAEASFNLSPFVLNSSTARVVRRSNIEDAEMHHEKGSLTNIKADNLHTGASVSVYGNGSKDKPLHVLDDVNKSSGKHVSGGNCEEIEELWLQTLQKIQINSIREFMSQEGKLISVIFRSAPTIQLMFSSQLTKSKAEKFKGHILQAFESVLGSPATIEIRSDSSEDAKPGALVPLILPATSNEGAYQMVTNRESISEIVEIAASPRELNSKDNINIGQSIKQGPLERKNFGQQLQSQSLVRSKVSLAHVIQQAEGCTKLNGWSKRKAVSIAEKLELENLRLEPRSRSLLCWKASRITRQKLSRWKIKTRRPHSLLKLVPCGRCLSTKSPR